MSSTVNQTDRFLKEAVASIDAQFGDGYARSHPELVASLIQASTINAAVEAGTTAHGEAMGLAQRLTSKVCETMLQLKPRLFG